MILHNFCIDEKDITIRSHLAKDKAYITTESDVTHNDRHKVNTNNLVGGGHYFDDTTYRKEIKNNNLPRSIMLAYLISKGTNNRPTPRGSSSTTN